MVKLFLFLISLIQLEILAINGGNKIMNRDIDIVIRGILAYELNSDFALFYLETKKYKRASDKKEMEYYLYSINSNLIDEISPVYLEIIKEKIDKDVYLTLSGSNWETEKGIFKLIYHFELT